jgi:uncharacterized protein (TIGR00369 family)
MQPADVSTLSGLELVQAMVAGTFPRPSIADTIPMQFLEARSGYVKFSARADHRHINPVGGVHGGFAATVLDSVTGCAVHTMLEAGIGYGTIDLHIKMLRPIPRDAELIAEGKLLHLSRSVAASEGSLKTGDGKLIAHATATCFVIRNEPRQP